MEKLLASQIEPLHEVRDEEKYEKLKKNMKFRGWHGLPLIVLDRHNEYKAINGSHRLAAAANCNRQVFGEIEIPVIILDEDELCNYIENETEYTFDDIFDQDLSKYILQGFNEEAAKVMEAEE
jgi:ParB-like chromosome segregation protein Spo0J